MATPTTTKGFPITCPMCSEENCITVQVYDVATLRCTECDGEIDAVDVRKMIGQWERLLAWLDTAPSYEG